MRRFFVLAAALLIGGAVIYFGHVGEADAAPAFEVETYFYSDSGMTNEVGWSYRPCNGPRITEGPTTAFRRSIQGEKCSSGYGTDCVTCLVNGWGRVPCPYSAEFQGYPACPGEPACNSFDANPYNDCG
jgi:hypothetical protein